MGSGKSTFIKENGLEPYTLSSDAFRLMVSNPVMMNGYFTMNQKASKMAWKLLLECLEARMIRGDFTIVDAMHLTKDELNKYNVLAEKYKYSIYYYQVDISLEECLKRNRTRPTIAQIPENVIINKYEILQKEQLNNKAKRIYSLSEIDNFYTEDITGKYDKVEIIGDVHSCASVLKEHLETYNKNTLYVFVGDYFDRGIEPKETWELIKALQKEKNVIMLEGNHEKWIYNYGSDIDTLSIQAKKTFAIITEGMTDAEIKDFKRDLRMFHKKLRQAYAFEFHGRKFIVNHGGLPYHTIPKMTYISTEDLIKGFWTHDTEVDEMYEENFNKGLCQEYIQVHGHRMSNSTEHSISLDGEIEHGGHLKWLEITPTTMEVKMLENKVYDIDFLYTDYIDRKDKQSVYITENEEVNALLNPYLIKVKENDFNTYSVNFSEKVFNRQIWNKSTIKARGLFVDRETGEVTARSYNKFFNIGEPGIEDVQLPVLKKNLKYPIKIAHKYNGFLGIVSVYKPTGEIIITSKSSTNSTHVGFFKKIFYKMDRRIVHILKGVLENHNTSAVFEVLSTLDVHTIKYGMDKIILLDFVENKHHINGANIDDDFSEKLKEELINELNKNGISDEHFGIAEVAGYVNSFEELMQFNEEVNSTDNIEGFVYKDANGFMFKFKVEYYNKWKHRKRLIDNLIKNPKEFNPLRCSTVEDVAYLIKVKNAMSETDKGVTLNGVSIDKVDEMPVAEIIELIPEDKDFNIDTHPYSEYLKNWTIEKETYKEQLKKSREGLKKYDGDFEDEEYIQGRQERLYQRNNSKNQYNDSDLKWF